MPKRAAMRLAAMPRRLAHLVRASRQVEEYPGTADNPHPGATWTPGHIAPLTISAYLSAAGYPVVEIDGESHTAASPHVYVNDVLVSSGPTGDGSGEQAGERAVTSIIPVELRTWREPNRMPGRPAWLTVVQYGPFELLAHSGPAARAMAADLVAGFLMDYREPQVLSYGRARAVVWLDPRGAYHGTTITVDGAVTPSTTLSDDSWDQALSAARFHLVELETDWHDDACVQAGYDYLAAHWFDPDGPCTPDELLCYAGFQRAVAAAPPDVDPEEWAGFHYAAFTPRAQPAAGPTGAEE